MAKKPRIFAILKKYKASGHYVYGAFNSSRQPRIANFEHPIYASSLVHAKDRAKIMFPKSKGYTNITVKKD